MVPSAGRRETSAGGASLRRIERHGDIYFSRDFPVLAAIADWEDKGRDGRVIDSMRIAQAIGHPRTEVIQSLGRLCRAGLIDCVDLTTNAGEDFWANRLTPAGLRETGLWPKSATLAEALTVTLRQEIEATAKSDPEKSRKLQVVLDGLSEFSSSFLAKLAGELIKNLSR